MTKPNANELKMVLFGMAGVVIVVLLSVLLMYYVPGVGGTH